MSKEEVKRETRFEVTYNTSSFEKKERKLMEIITRTINQELIDRGYKIEDKHFAKFHFFQSETNPHIRENWTDSENMNQVDLTRIEESVNKKIKEYMESLDNY